MDSKIEIKHFSAQKEYQIDNVIGNKILAKQNNNVNDNDSISNAKLAEDQNKTVNLSKSPKISSKSQKLVERTFKFKEFKNITQNDAINKLIYGTTIKKSTHQGNGPWHSVYFYILPEDPSILQWLSGKKSFNLTRINLKYVTSITDLPVKSYGKYIDRNSKLMLAIQYNNNYEILLHFNNEQEKNEWWYGLQYFVKMSMIDYRQNPRNSELSTDIFHAVDRQGDKKITRNEMMDVFKLMNIHISKKDAMHLFDQIDKDKNNYLDYKEFLGLIDKLSIREELLPLYKQYCVEYSPDDHNKPLMKINELIKFFETEQKQILTMEEATIIVNNVKYKEKDNDKNNDQDKNKDNKNKVTSNTNLSFIDFINILYEDNYNSMFKPENEEVYQNMNHPLNDYYICSCHNIIPFNPKLTRDDIINAYINALKNGFRCIELDFWDGDDDDSEPLIYSNRLMETKVYFEDFCKAIKTYGFDNNPYPIIISFNIYCNPSNQQKILEIMKKELNELIYKLPTDFEKYDHLPSLYSLKNKILIKGKHNLNGFISDWENHEYRNFCNSINSPLTSALNDIKSRNSNQILSLNNNRNFTKGSRNTISTPINNPNLNSKIKHTVNLNSSSNIENYDSTIISNPTAQKTAINSSSLLMNKQDEIVENQGSPRGESKKEVDATEKNPLNLDQLSTNYNNNSMDINTKNNSAYTPTDMTTDTKTNIKQPNINTVKFNDVTKSTPTDHKTTTKFTSDHRNMKTDYSVDDEDSYKNYDYVNTINDINDPTNILIYHERGRKPIKNISINIARKSKLVNKPHNQNDHIDLSDFYAFFNINWNLTIKRYIWHIASINETNLMNILKVSYNELVNFHKKYINKIYPSGIKISSVNFDPIPIWNAGIQIAALNYQCSDEMMYINYAKFIANGAFGYILKPKSLLGLELESYDSKKNLNYTKSQIQSLSIRVISGKQLKTLDDNKGNIDSINPFVEVKLCGPEKDENDNQSMRTHTVNNNSFNPVWSYNFNECKAIFKITDPDFSTIIFRVMNDKQTGPLLIGWYAIEIKNLRQGYRVFNLLDNNFQLIKYSNIMCHIIIEENNIIDSKRKSISK